MSCLCEIDLPTTTAAAPPAPRPRSRKAFRQHLHRLNDARRIAWPVCTSCRLPVHPSEFSQFGRRCDVCALSEGERLLHRLRESETKRERRRALKAIKRFAAGR
jgi:hypothetical protein